MNICMESGTLIRIVHGLKEKVQYEMFFLDETYVDDVMELQEMVFHDLDDKQLFVPDSRDFILNEVLKPGSGKMIGVFCEGKLIAYRSINYAGDDEYNLGKELDISEEELDKVAVLESTVVHPHYRGNRLQAKLLKHTLEVIEDEGYYHIVTTVSPLNYPSLKNVMRVKLTIRDLKERAGVYEGKTRFLLWRDIREPVREDYEEITTVKNTDFLKQKELLKKGFIGFALKKELDGFYIVYGKLTP